jgi:hypothetical protein
MLKCERVNSYLWKMEATMSPITVSVDVGIGECVQVLDSIAARRASRKESYLSNLCDDLEAATTIINTLDNLFIELVLGFKDPRVVEDQVALGAHLEETMKYLSIRQLLPALERLTGSIMGAAQNKRLKRFKDLVSTLEDLVRALEAYREELGRGRITGVGQKQEWNLMSLWECAKGYREKEEVSLAEMAEQVHRNHDFALSDRIHTLAGQAIGHAKAAAMR